MKGVPVLDELMANAWPPTSVESHGGWRYRWAQGVTQRANSALALGANRSFGELVDRAEAFYRLRAAPTVIQVSSASAPIGLGEYLRERGYRSGARTLVECTAAHDVLQATGSNRVGSPRYRIEVTAAPTDEWFEAYWTVESGRGRSNHDGRVCREAMLAPDLPAVFAAARDGASVVGVGQLVIERGWGGVQCMATDRTYRRRGVATAVLHGLAEEATRRRVESMYLAVMADNEAGTTTYRRAGFMVAHEYSHFEGPPRFGEGCCDTTE